MNSEDTPEIVLLYRDELKGYDFGIGHPFRGDRYRLFSSLFSEVTQISNPFTMVRSEPANDEMLRLICDQDYITFSRDYFGTGKLNNGILDRFNQYHSGDNYPQSRPIMVEQAARYVIGQAKEACEMVVNDDCLKAISIGGGLHHAKHNFGEGFCIYNDVAYCGKYLVEKLGLERVLILDTDAHAGNGTSDYFYEDPRVLFIDMHQDPDTVYPGTGFVDQVGTGAGEGYTINIPLPPGSDDAAYKAAFDSVILPVTREFKPQIVIQNGGSDPHEMDELTNLNLSLEGFKMVGSRVSDMAAVCDGKLVSLIASGYNMGILPYAWLSLISGITGFHFDIHDMVKEQKHAVPGYTDETALQVLTNVKNTHSKYWKCFN